MFYSFISFALCTAIDELRAETPAYVLAKYSEQQKQLATALYSLLKLEAPAAGLSKAFHAFIWSLVTREADVSALNQFDSPCVQWLIGASLNADGSFKTPQNISPICAKTKYFLRCIHIHQVHEEPASGGLMA